METICCNYIWKPVFYKTLLQVYYSCISRGQWSQNCDTQTYLYEMKFLQALPFLQLSKSKFIFSLQNKLFPRISELVCYYELQCEVRIVSIKQSDRIV